jgi:hypothetical protein
MAEERPVMASVVVSTQIARQTGSALARERATHVLALRLIAERS